MCSSNFFFREWWAGKVDKPSKEMFRLLQKKKEKDYLPLMRDEDGNRASCDQENKAPVQAHFQRLFSSTLLSSAAAGKKRYVKRKSLLAGSL